MDYQRKNVGQGFVSMHQLLIGLRCGSGQASGFCGVAGIKQRDRSCVNDDKVLKVTFKLLMKWKLPGCSLKTTHCSYGWAIWKKYYITLLFCEKFTILCHVGLTILQVV